DALDCEFIATGHYVQVREEASRYIISKGVDATKDQSYVLWGLSQECLRRSIYPLGHLHKTEVRQMALDYGYPELAKKSESYEICFVPDNDYREFLKKKVTGLEDEVNGGEFVLSDGTVVGTHKGYPFYTIGQRKGLDIALGKPMYVTHIDPEHNRVTLGSEEELERFDIRVSRLNMIKYDTIKNGMPSLTKIRYKSAATPSVLEMNQGIVGVRFDQAVKGVAPGQSAVFYEGDDVIAGGIILA
ncbi:MAG TPA: tRNA 2-thiouridine(34) synthase MnmA, partial [Chitinophagaceae bacterium]|nr:tRNA 2-thiouridine(34) synthase MnmA [Chitinophagaceae bacterium]